jgi:hypothetical protein
MQTEDKARYARLEQLFDEKQAENDQLKAELEQRIADLERENAELRRAIRDVVENSMDLLRAIERNIDHEKTSFENILGRPISGTRLVEHLINDRENERAAS